MDLIHSMLFGGEAVKLDDLLDLDMDSLIEQIKSYIKKSDYDIDKYDQFRIQINFDDLIHITKINNKESVVKKFTKLLQRAEHYRNIISIKVLMSRIKAGTPMDNADYIMLVNNCLDMIINDTITILDLPVEIQNAIRDILQNELVTE